MAVTTAPSKGAANAGPGSLRIGLFAPGMTTLHRVGLAGLWMTLRAIDEEPRHAVLRGELRGLGE